MAVRPMESPSTGPSRRLEQDFSSWLKEKLFLGQSPGQYLRAQATPFNLVAAVILLVGLSLTVLRFGQGLGATTNLSDTTPWGLWIGFDVLVGVALAAGGFVTGTAVYILRLEEYRPVVRPAILTGFLGYFFVVVALLFDLGQPWRLPYPMIGYFGVTSVMFLVAWHVLLYLSCQFAEICPALFEWLGWSRARQWAVGLTFGATIFGVMLSTLHQSALGALFLLAPYKLHPLWYSPLIPGFFFVSAIAAGLSMVIFESTLSHHFWGRQTSMSRAQLDRLALGLGKAAALVLFVYFWLKILGIMHENRWALLATPMGVWFLVEILGFVALPSFLFFWGVRTANARLVRLTSALAVLGIVLNRLNVAVIAFKWNLPDRYVPAWSEFAITIFIVTLLLLTFRWIVNRMPILYEHPDYPGGH